MNTDAVLRILICALGLSASFSAGVMGVMDNYKGADPADHFQYSFMQRERIYEFAE